MAEAPDEDEGPNVAAVDLDQVDLLSCCNASSESLLESEGEITLVDPAVQEWANKNRLHPGILTVLADEGYTTLDAIKRLKPEAVDRWELKPKHDAAKGIWFAELKKALPHLIPVEPGFKEWLTAFNLTDETVKVLLEQNYTSKESLQPLVDPENIRRSLPILKAQQQDKLIEAIHNDKLDRMFDKDPRFHEWTNTNGITKETALVLLRECGVRGYNDVMSLKCQNIVGLRDKIPVNQMECLKKAILERNYEQCGEQFKTFLLNAQLTKQTRLRIVEENFTTVDSLKILRKPGELHKRFHELQAEQYQLLDNAIKSKFYVPGLTWDQGDLHLMVVGKTGNGKSKTCNTILGEDRLNASASLSSETAESQLQRSDSGNFCIMDTIGLEDTTHSTFEVVKWLVKAIFGMKPAAGPNAILFIVTCNRFTDNDYALYMFLKCVFGDGVVEHIIVVFTHADQIEEVNRAPETYLMTCPETLRTIIKECGNRCVFFDNTKEGMNVEQIENLKTQIKKIPRRPSGRRLRQYKLEIKGISQDQLETLWRQMRSKVRWGDDNFAGRQQILKMLDMTSSVELMKIIGDGFDFIAIALGAMRSVSTSPLTFQAITRSLAVS